MSYFEQILGGNIPLSVIESMEGFQNEARMATRFPHVQIKGGKGKRPYPGVLAMLASDYANHVNMSMALKRDDLVRGVRALLTGATNDALARNKLDIVKLGDMDASKLSEVDKAMMKKVTAQVSADLSKSLLKAVEGLNFPSENKDILVNIMHLTGLTNKSTKDLVDITKKLGLLLELHQSFTPDIMINIIDSLNNKLNPAAIKKCKDKLVLECLFDDQFINSMAENMIDVLDNILGNMMRTTKHGKVCKFYALSIDISRALALSLPKKLEKFGEYHNDDGSCADGSEERFADGSCADGSCADGSEERFADGSCADGSCADGSEERFADGSCADGSCADGSEERFADGSCADGSCADGSEERFTEEPQVEYFTSSGFSFIDKYSHLFGARALERENFGVDIGNTVNIKDKKKMQDIAEIEKKIDQSKVIEGMGSFVTKAVNSAASSNKADLMKSLTASNRISIDKAKAKGTIKISGIKQNAAVKSNTDATFVQEISNKITTDISNSMKEQISTSSKQLTEDLKKSKEDIKAGTNIGDIANTVGDTVKGLGESFAKILSASVGNSLSNEKEEESLKSVKDKFNLDQSFKQKNKKDVSNDIATALKSENLAKCVNDAAAKNDLSTGSLESETGEIIIDNIQQDAIIDDVMKCAFNQKVTNEIATKLVSNFDNMVKDMIENVDKKLSDTQIAKIQGDIYATGVAAAMALESAGKAAKDAGAGISEAAKGVGAGASEAAQGVGKGVGTAAEGVGKGVASVASSLTMPLIAAAVLGIVALAIYFLVFKKKSPIGQALEGAITNVATPASMPLNVAEVMTQKGGLDLLEFINQLSDTPVFRK